MLLRISGIFICITIVLISSGQTPNYQYDSLIKRIIERNVIGPECPGCEHTGILLLEVSKTDSVRTRTEYVSDKLYDLGNDANLLKRLNERGKDFIKGEYKVIVPIYFYYDGTKPSEKLIKSVEEKIRELKRNKNVMSTVYLITYAAKR